MTTPTDTARLALDDMAATLDRLRVALADAYGRAGTSLTEAGHSVAAAEDRARKAERRAEMAGALTAATKRLMERRTNTLRERAQAAEQDAERFKADALAACKTIADMHEAATGRTGMGPIRGVVEDVADVRTRADQAEERIRNLTHQVAELRRCNSNQAQTIRDTAARATKAEADRDHEAATREQAQQEAAQYERSADSWRTQAGAADDRGNRWQAKADRTDATLQRVRDAGTLAQALAAVAEHDGLSPIQAAMSAAFATAAEQPAAITAERDRAHAIQLAEAEQRTSQAEQDASHAEAALARVRTARTAAEAWTALGTYYGMPATEAGRAARAWRTTADQLAERHARRAEDDVKELAAQHDRHRRTLAAVFALSADTTTFDELTEYAARTLTRSGERLLASKARADTAEATIGRVRALLDTHLGPLATAAVRAALDTPTEG